MAAMLALLSIGLCFNKLALQLLRLQQLKASMMLAFLLPLIPCFEANNDQAQVSFKYSLGMCDKSV